jgi:hypothetical protein
MDRIRARLAHSRCLGGLAQGEAAIVDQLEKAAVRLSEGRDPAADRMAAVHVSQHVEGARCGVLDAGEVALLEVDEVHGRRKHGASYARTRSATPFGGSWRRSFAAAWCRRVVVRGAGYAAAMKADARDPLAETVADRRAGSSAPESSARAGAPEFTCE